LDEIGIQLFALQRFDEALDKFRQAKKIRLRWLGSTHPKIAMVLNNIACCNFQMGNHLAALVTFQEARDIQQHKGGATEGDLDLLHDAITLCNLGYMKLHLKQYEEAQAIFQEALLVSESLSHGWRMGTADFVVY
jgi:tetratricopeptide (TPR) repeat protein